jgi:hypothetical protein
MRRFNCGGCVCVRSILVCGGGGLYNEANDSDRPTERGHTMTYTITDNYNGIKVENVNEDEVEIVISEMFDNINEIPGAADMVADWRNSSNEIASYLGITID